MSESALSVVLASCRTRMAVDGEPRVWVLGEFPDADTARARLLEMGYVEATDGRFVERFPERSDYPSDSNGRFDCGVWETHEQRVAEARQLWEWRAFSARVFDYVPFDWEVGDGS